MTVFEKTPSITPYLFAFVAGAYAVERRSGKIPGREEPLRINFLARQSIAEDAKKVYDYMFDCIIKGIHFYSDFFGTDFPWQK